MVNCHSPLLCDLYAHSELEQVIAQSWRGVKEQPRQTGEKAAEQMEKMGTGMRQQ